jgi:hypothetical protein
MVRADFMSQISIKNPKRFNIKMAFFVDFAVFFRAANDMLRCGVTKIRSPNCICVDKYEKIKRKLLEFVVSSVMESLLLVVFFELTLFGSLLTCPIKK